jgi:hypothetical protein
MKAFEVLYAVFIAAVMYGLFMFVAGLCNGTIVL